MLESADLPMKISVKLNVMREHRKMKLKDLASEVGITPENLSRLENEKRGQISFDLLCRLCVALDCRPGQILRLTDDEGKPLPPPAP